MKNMLLLFTVLCLFSSSINAQSNLSKFKIGLLAKIEDNSISKTFSFDEYTGYFASYNQTNYSVGLNVEYLLKSNLSINTGVNYSNKDFEGTFYCAVCEYIVAPTPQKVDFKFIEVPLTLKYYFLKDSLKPYGKFGVNNLFSLNEDVVDNSYALAIQIGAGVAYKLTNRLSVLAEVDYDHGITKFYDQSDFKLKTFGFGVGFMAHL